MALTSNNRYLLYFWQLLWTICLSVTSYTQVTIKVISTPSIHKGNERIYVACNLNNWNPGDPSFELKRDQNGILSINLTPSIGKLKLKFTRGSWEKVECDVEGKDIPDRVIEYEGMPIEVEMQIYSWHDSQPISSTASEQVHILSDSFYIPQLGRKRKIWIYLPKNYTASNDRFPVMYMQDGQNLFDQNSSFSQEWRIDEALDSLSLAGDTGCIVVGIENGGSERLNEYSPWANDKYGGGQGDEYVKFISSTLKPYVDKNYRTLPNKENTAIFGSSMGGLISFYAGIAYPDIFGKVGAFSSSFWFSDKISSFVISKGIYPESYFYLIVGEKEAGTQKEDLMKMVETLTSQGIQKDHIKYYSHNDGQHNEWYWSREFVAAYNWFFNN